MSFWQLMQAKAEDPYHVEEPVVFTFAETPESARTEAPNPDAEIASDKNAAAQNPQAPDNLESGEAYSDGLIAEADQAPEIAEQMTLEQPEPAGAGEESMTSENEASEIPYKPFVFAAPTFHREFLTGDKSPALDQKLPESSPGKKHTDSRSPALGNFSLNTYEWDFAPYMLWLKKRVQSNIYPPPAFTHMGMISGTTNLRFRIYLDGTLRTLELLSYKGHDSLMRTSVRAIELSAPFRKLPEDFPEPYLEITAKFEYIVLH